MSVGFSVFLWIGKPAFSVCLKSWMGGTGAMQIEMRQQALDHIRIAPDLPLLPRTSSLTFL